MRITLIAKLLSTTLAVVTPAFAQAQSTSSETAANTDQAIAADAPVDIVVTGSRIARPELQQA